MVLNVFLSAIGRFFLSFFVKYCGATELFDVFWLVDI